jgi:hypothetical protein
MSNPTPTKELLKNIEEWQKKLRTILLSYPPSSLPFDEFVYQIATAERKAGREEMMEILEEEKKRFRCGACDGAKCEHTQCCQCIADIKSKLLSSSESEINNTEREN